MAKQLKDSVKQVSAPIDTLRKINLNTANFDDLVKLPGIGPKKAREILRMRQKLGGFKNWEQILKVKGIGPKTLKRLKKLCTLK